MDAAGVPQADSGLEEGHDVSVAQRTQHAGGHAHSERAARPNHEICCRADGDSASQRGVLDMHLQQ